MVDQDDCQHHFLLNQSKDQTAGWAWHSGEKLERVVQPVGARAATRCRRAAESPAAAAGRTVRCGVAAASAHAHAHRGRRLDVPGTVPCFHTACGVWTDRGQDESSLIMVDFYPMV